MRTSITSDSLVCGIALLIATFGAAQDKKKPALDEKKIATEQEIELHLKAVDPAVGGDRAAHLKWFAGVLPPNDEIKAVVARKLIDFAQNDRSAPVRGRAGAALPNWATEEIGPKLLLLMNGNGPTEKQGAITAVGRIKYLKGIPALIRCLELNSNPSLVVKALIEIGSPCEDSVAALLESKQTGLVKGAL